MPRTSQGFVPSYRKHKPTNQAAVDLNGRTYYLGRYGSAGSRREYDRLIAEWLVGGRSLANGSRRSVSEVILAYLRFAETYYRGSGEVEKVKLAVKPLRALYGRMEAEEISPLRLKAVQQVMIDAGLSRRTINMRISCIKRIFKWATENEIVAPGIYHGLAAVSGLKQGRSGAREAKIVGPVPEAFVDAVLPHVNRHVRALIQLQRITGARSGELIVMQAADIDRSDARIWVYRPQRHKNQFREHCREIYLGPACQRIIRPFLQAEDFLFSPKAAREERYRELRAKRKSPVQPSQLCRRKIHAKKLPGERYTPRSYRGAILAACKKANVPAWFPHQLRHSVGTKLRKEFGLEVSRVLLGHKSIVAAQLYAEADKVAAMEVAGRVA
jgi:integrase